MFIIAEIIATITRALVPYDSSDDDEKNPNDEQYNWHVMEMRI